MSDKNEIVIDSEILKEVEDRKNPRLPPYLVAESKLQETGKIVSIFNLDLEAVIYEKMYILFEVYQKLEYELEEVKIELQIKKEKLLLETDFKTILDSNRPTIAEKDAYMRPFLAELEDKVDEKDKELKWYKNKLKILNDLIGSKRLLLEIEADLKR